MVIFFAIILPITKELELYMIRKIKIELNKFIDSIKEIIERFIFASIAGYLLGVLLHDIEKFPKNIELLKEKFILTLTFGYFLLSYPIISFIINRTDFSNETKEALLYVIYMFLTIIIAFICGFTGIGIGSRTTSSFSL